jgi:hypothetical protein
MIYIVFSLLIGLLLLIIDDHPSHAFLRSIRPSFLPTNLIFTNNEITGLAISTKRLAESSSESQGIIPTASIKRRQNGLNPVDDRNSLPYAVYSIQDELQKSIIGTYMLDAAVTSGDILDLGIKGLYTVKRISFLYKYTRNGFRVYQKKIDVVASNSWIAKDFSESDRKANKFFQ